MQSRHKIPMSAMRATYGASVAAELAAKLAAERAAAEREAMRHVAAYGEATRRYGADTRDGRAIEYNWYLSAALREQGE